MRKTLFLIALTAAFVLLMTWLPGKTARSEDAAKPTPAPESTGKHAAAVEKERTELATPEEFKSYLDAERQAIAREREALLSLKAQVKEETDRLLALQKQIDERFAKEDEKQEEKIRKLVKIYSSMRPDEVGPLLSRLEEDTAVRILSVMKPKEQADLLARMSPDKAAEFSKKLIAKDF